MTSAKEAGLVFLMHVVAASLPLAACAMEGAPEQEPAGIANTWATTRS